MVECGELPIMISREVAFIAGESFGDRSERADAQVVVRFCCRRRHDDWGFFGTEAQ